MTDDPKRAPRAPTLDELRTFFVRDFPQSTVTLEALAPPRARVRQAISDAHLRPGGTVSGPAMMAVADAAAYAALLGVIGIVPLAVTTDLSIHFMRKPSADRALVAEAEMLKIGRSLAVADVRVTSEGEGGLVAQATITYAIPPDAPRADRGQK